jgi:hypothetical protein
LRPTHKTATSGPVQQPALVQDGDLRGYAVQLGLDAAAFDRDRDGAAVADRIRRDVDSGLGSGQVLGTPTLFIDGVVHRLRPARPADRAGHKGCGEQVAGGRAAEGRHPSAMARTSCVWQVVEPVGGLDGLKCKQVARWPFHTPSRKTRLRWIPVATLGYGHGPSPAFRVERFVERPAR